MPSKTEEYLALAQRTANGLTRYWESWTDYLTIASRLYKYPFADQLMIYAQRRNAAARDEDPGLMLISRRPPQQKYTSFEEYMDAHGGATAPIEDHSEEV